MTEHYSTHPIVTEIVAVRVTSGRLIAQISRSNGKRWLELRCVPADPRLRERPSRARIRLPLADHRKLEAVCRAVRHAVRAELAKPKPEAK